MIAFGMAWAWWTGTLLATGISSRNPLFQLLVLPGAFSPAIAAIVVRRWVTREGFADAGLRLNLAGNLRYYLFGLLWPFGAVVIIVMLATILDLSRPDFSLLRALGEIAPGEEMPTFPTVLWPMLLVQFPISAVILTPILWGEEFGWRGYLQLRFFGESPLLAAVATGLI